MSPVTAATAAPELREVGGPSALGGGWRRFFSLLWLMSVTEFKRTYFGTVLGYLWSLVRPLMLFAVLLFVFTKIIRVGSGLPYYPVLLLLGIVLYSFFQEATNSAVTSVVAQEGVVRKTQFPRLVIPISVVLTSGFNLMLNLVIVFAFILAWGVDPAWTWLLFPLALLFLFALAAGLAMMLSALYVRFRDAAIIWAVVAQTLFYATPILYPLGKKGLNDPSIEHLLMINPLAVIFVQVRVWVLEPEAPTAVEAAGSAAGLIPAVVIFFALCGLGVWVFKREAPRIAEEL
jgi:ABC-2 type transport system permease protein